MARQNDHTRAEELISAYLDKRTSAEEQIFFERHVASCADCRAQLEATRSMVVALKAMPAVKAPRSFVLPREMARQPRQSFLSLYPTLRLATVIAAMAFVVLFAGDLLINQSVGRGAPQSIPAAAPAPAVIQAPAAQRAAAPTAAPQPTTAPAAAPTTAPAPLANADNTATATSAASAAAMAGAAAQAPISATAVTTEATALSMTTATPEATFAAAAAPQSKSALAATPEPTRSAFDQRAAATAEQSAAANTASPAPTIEPLHVVEIALLVLVIMLGIATLIVRRKVHRKQT